MSDVATQISLQQIEFSPYLNEQGEINSELEGKIGIYAIFNQEQQIQYIGYSRNLLTSLKQHLVRQVDDCFWFKVHIIERPNRSVLEKIRNDWIAESELQINEQEQKNWAQAIDVRQAMTEAEEQQYQQEDEFNQGKLLKKVARRVQEKILEKLENRGVTMKMRFNPKLKEEGLLDLK